jgi:hypothetical protein
MLLNESFLREQYIENKKNIAMISREFGISKYVIKRNLIALNIEIKNHPPSKIIVNKEWLINQYEINKLSANAIAEKLNVTNVTVLFYLRKFGISVRVSGSKKGKESFNYGKRRSPEQKKRMSEMDKKKWKDLIYAKKHSDALKGEKCYIYGKHHSKSTKLKMSIAHQKEKCHFWKGGKSYETYGINFTRLIKEYIRDKFNRRCYICEISESNNKRKLDIHHINYNKNDAREYNLVSLCRNCHPITNGNRWYWFNLLKDNWITNYIDFNSILIL